jgi:class II lanthipeptide synthase
MSVYRQAVAAALEALRIESPTSFSWYGEPNPALSAEVAAAMGAEAAQAYLQDQLRNRLYSSFYCSGRPVPQQLSQLVGGPQPPGPSPFVDSLSLANSGAGSRDPGWTVARVEDDGALVVHRHGLSLWARPEEVMGVDLSPGSEVSVTLPSELRRLSPGFYMALGDAEMDPAEPLVRHYWNLSSSGGTTLVAVGTRLLNRAGLPFRLKVLGDPSGYSRCDAGVLYTPRRRQAEVATLLPALLAEVAEHLKPGAPALTKQLAAGLAVAEDPGGGDSFGTHRCGLIASAAVQAFELGIETTAERLDLVEQHFDAAGIRFENPYLNAGSADEYELVA